MRNVSSQSFVTHARRALRPLAVPTLLALASLTTGCSSGDDDAAGAPGASAGAITLTQANNYTSVSSLSVMAFPAAAKENLKICWTDVVQDIQGHDVDAVKDIDVVSFVPLKTGDKSVVEGWLNFGQLDEGKVNGLYYDYTTNGTDTCTTLDTLKSKDGVALDPEKIFVTDDKTTYLMVFQTGTQIGYGARTMVFLDPADDSLVTDINAVDKSRSMLDYSADLTTGEKLQLPADKPSLVDWSGVQTDAQGTELIANAVDRILVGFYAGKDVKALEAGFLNLDQPTEAEGGPTKSWELLVPKGKAANLAAATNRDDGSAFTSFSADGDGTWLMGMFCSACQNPAPVIVTILDPQ